MKDAQIYNASFTVSNREIAYRRGMHMNEAAERLARELAHAIVNAQMSGIRMQATDFQHSASTTFSLTTALVDPDALRHLQDNGKQLAALRDQNALLAAAVAKYRPKAEELDQLRALLAEPQETR